MGAREAKRALAVPLDCVAFEEINQQAPKSPSWQVFQVTADWAPKQTRKKLGTRSKHNPGPI
jgi:hypothetical protein